MALGSRKLWSLSKYFNFILLHIVCEECSVVLKNGKGKASSKFVAEPKIAYYILSDKQFGVSHITAILYSPNIIITWWCWVLLEFPTHSNTYLQLRKVRQVRGQMEMEILRVCSNCVAASRGRRVKSNGVRSPAQPKCLISFSNQTSHFPEWILTQNRQQRLNHHRRNVADE